MTNKVKLKRIDVINMYRAIQELSVITDLRLAMVIALNRGRHLRPLVEAIEDTVNPSKQFKSFDRQRVDLCEEYSKLDETGNPDKRDGKFNIDEARRSEFNAKMIELKEKYADARETEKKRPEMVEEFLKEEMEIELQMIKHSEITKDKVLAQVSAVVLESMLPMISMTE